MIQADPPAHPAPDPRDFVEVATEPGLRIDLRYATVANVFGHAIDGALDRLLLHPIAAAKLREAAAGLQRAAPGGSLLVFDGLRPDRVQRILWLAVRGTPLQAYVADPAVGSIHSFGLAVDLSWCGPDGAERDMGTPFDSFGPLAEPRLEEQFRAAGLLTAEQIENRRLLRDVMKEAGFHPIPIEWWHFDALPPDDVRRGFPRVDS